MTLEHNRLETRSNRKTRWLVITLLGAGLATFIGANVHLLYVAFSSQPQCVEHAKVGTSAPGEHAAAKSAC